MQRTFAAARRRPLSACHYDGIDGRTLSGVQITNSGMISFGDRSGSTDFQTLLAGTTINGVAASYVWDGVYTNVVLTPLPAALPLLVSGLGVLGGLLRRRRREA